MSRPSILDRVTGVCHQGRHDRCRGRIVTPYLGPRRDAEDQHLACACECHPVEGVSA